MELASNIHTIPSFLLAFIVLKLKISKLLAHLQKKPSKMNKNEKKCLLSSCGDPQVPAHHTKKTY